MLRMVLCLAFLCAGCVAEQPESARTVAAFEVPLPTPSDKSEFLDLLRKEAEENGYHVDAASPTELVHMSAVSRITFNAAVWRGNDDEAIASAMDFQDHIGRVWLTFARGEDPESVRQFRDALLPHVVQRWPETSRLPLMPNGAIPLARDLVRTPSGYEVNPSAAAKYQINAPAGAEADNQITPGSRQLQPSLAGDSANVR